MSGSQDIVELISAYSSRYKPYDEQRTQKIAQDLMGLGDGILLKLHDASIGGRLDFDGHMIYQEVLRCIGPTEAGLSILESELSADHDYDVWSTAISALTRFGPSGLQILADAIDRSRNRIEEIIKGESSGDEKVRRFEKEDLLGQTIVTGVYSRIGDIGDIEKKLPAIPLLIKLVEDENEKVYQLAIEALGRIGHPEAASALIGEIAKEHIFKMEACMEALGNLCVRGTSEERWPQILSMMDHCMGNDSDAIRAAGSLALSRVADKTDDPGLLDKLWAIADRHNDRTLKCAVSEREKSIPPQAVRGTLSSGTVEPPKNADQNGTMANSPVKSRPIPPPLPKLRPPPPPQVRPAPPPLPQSRPTGGQHVRPQPPPLPPKRIKKV